MMPHDESTRDGAPVRRGTMCSVGTDDGGLAPRSCLP
jgi:hypothetical protein